MKKARFFVHNICLIEDKEDIDLSEIPSSIKRRLSNVDKTALSLLLKSYEEDIDKIVFSSEYGEFDRLKNIIEEYNTYNEVSPIQFSGSVHNFPTGSFCQIKKTNVSYNVISADENSISTGIIESIISENKKVLFCYADFYNDFKGVSFIISKEKLENSIECEIEQTKGKTDDEFQEIKNFIEGKEFKSALCLIKRV